jgi:hypothetical protein
MNAVDTSSSSSSSSDNASQRLAAVRMPIEEPVDDFDEAVQKLKQCSSTELRRARQHHRRALESLRQGGYSALSNSTRDHLIGRLSRNLKALNYALDATASPPETDDDSDSPKDESSLSSYIRALFQALW